MNERNLKPWPHSPGIIAAVDEYMRVVEEYGRPYTIPAAAADATHVVNSHRATIFGKSKYFSSYELAFDWCIEQKRLAAWHEEQLTARNPAPMVFPNYSLADEMAV
jgi:hypothetical protein